MRVLRSHLAVALVLLTPAGLAGCGSSEEQEAAKRANDAVPTTSTAAQNAQLDAQDVKSAEALKKQAGAADGAVKDVKDAVEGAVQGSVDEAEAETKARAEKATAGAQQATAEAIANARREAEKARDQAEKVLGDVQKSIEDAQPDIPDISDLQVPETDLDDPDPTR